MLDKIEVGKLKLEFEEKIRQGRLFELRKKLQSLSHKDLPREDYAIFANFARRVGAPTWSLKQLRPIVRMEPEMQQLLPPASGSETASYALALAASGALFEAQELAQSIEHLDLPDTLQACAYVSVWNWDYKRAVPFFRRYLSLPQLSEFQRTLAQINLARAHTFLGHWVKAQELVELILPVAKEMKWSLVERDALLVLAEVQVRDENWSFADATIQSALQLSESVGLDGLDVLKWKAILHLSQAPSPSGFQNFILPIQQKARSRHRWEIARDLDFTSAKILQTRELLDHVYFGTPFLYFRKRMLEECRSYWQPSAEYLWSPVAEAGALTLDLKSGCTLGRDSSNPFKGLSLNLMRLLTSDFYRPFKRGCILAEMYPDQHFDVKNMAHNLANLMHEIRKAIQHHQLPIEIVYQKNCYHLKLAQPMGFLIQDPALKPYDNVAQDNETVKSQLRRLRKKWPYQSFTAKQVAEFLTLPQNQIRQLLKSSFAESQLVLVGETRSRRYRFRGLREAS